MVQRLILPSFQDKRGSLIAIEKEIIFPIKRVYFIYDTNELSRAGHRHKETHQALICLQGSCLICIRRLGTVENHLLEVPTEALLLDPLDWHEISFSKPSILLVLASTSYSAEDYVYDCL